MGYSAILIGLGSIGMEYDYDAENGEYILTHANALNEHPSFSLIGGVDISLRNRKDFEHKYHKLAYSSIDKLK